MSLWNIYKAKKLGIGSGALFDAVAGKRLGRSYETITESVPYVSRISANGADIGNKSIDTIVGGTIAWNQLVQAGDTSITVPSGHIYMSKINDVQTVALSAGAAISINNAAKDNVFDLTQMFGSSIANYIYSLEQNQAGKGVSYFRKLFPESYYPYCSGSLIHVNASAHIMRDVRGNIIGNYSLDDSLTLYGIPQLDANNNLYYDGDTYESDGKVTRKYGIVNLGAGDWKYESGAHSRFWLNIGGIKKVSPTSVKAKIICSKYVTDTLDNIYAHRTDKTIGVEASNGRIWVYDSSAGTDASAFKALMDGIYLVYELGTATTSSAEPFTNPQKITGYGTEEYVVSKQNGVEMTVGHNTQYDLSV